MTLRHTILTLLGWICALAVHAHPAYRTQRLARIAQALQLTLPADLGANSCVDSVLSFQGIPIRVRTNALGEVSHVGYRLFSNDIRESLGHHAATDFMERYVLEADLRLPDDGFYSRARLVQRVRGELSLLKRNRTEAQWNMEYTARRNYRLTCILRQDTLEVAFPADAQLLLGADAKEQEEIFERELDLATSADSFPDYTQDWRALLNATPTDSVGLINEGTYLSDEIRSDLYVVQHGGDVTLLNSTAQNVKSMSNLLLTGDSRQTIPVRLTIDKYGYTRSLHVTTLARWISLLKSENNRLYFGAKNLQEGTLSCTLFVLNEALAYTHVFSVEAPLSLLSGSEEPIRALGYLYIPLQNVTESFFRAGYNQ